jgi:hypothetical protein
VASSLFHLTEALGFDSRGEVVLQWWILSHGGENIPWGWNYLFAPPFYLTVESVLPWGWTKGWTFPLEDKVQPWGPGLKLKMVLWPCSTCSSWSWSWWRRAARSWRCRRSRTSEEGASRSSDRFRRTCRSAEACDLELNYGVKVANFAIIFAEIFCSKSHAFNSKWKQLMHHTCKSKQYFTEEMIICIGCSAVYKKNEFRLNTHAWDYLHKYVHSNVSKFDHTTKAVALRSIFWVNRGDPPKMIICNIEPRSWTWQKEDDDVW